MDPAVPYLVLFWLAACGLDAWNTIRYRDMIQYEQNPVMRAVLSRRRAGPVTAMTVALGVEALLVLASPLIIIHEWDLSLLGVAALAAGSTHVVGYVQTRSFLRGRTGESGVPASSSGKYTRLP